MVNSKPERLSRKIRVITYSLSALTVGLFFFFFLLLSSVAIFQMIYLGRIFPGVYVQDLHLGGKSIEEAAVYLTQKYQFSKNNDVNLIYLNEEYPIFPKQLGIQLDAVSTAQKAYQFGRNLPLSTWIWQQTLIFAPYIEIAPVYIFNEQDAIDQLNVFVNELDQPMIEAQLKIEGISISAIPAQIGRKTNIESTLQIIQDEFKDLNPDSIHIQVEQQVPTLLDASDFIPLAQEILNEPFVIQAPILEDLTNHEWIITPNNLAPMLEFKVIDDNSEITPQFHNEYLRNFVISIAEKINSLPENTRFIFNDDTRELDLHLSSIDGFSIEIDDSVENIQSALANGHHSANLSIEFQAPEVNDSATAEELGIKELVHKESSYFYGSDSSRLHNIEKAAAQFHGLLIPPGETFSMANAMGEISLDSGYSEALIIYNGKTIEGVGGGVCQVSTTLFRTAFFAGFPIVERHPHAYRVNYYEKISGNSKDSNLAGLDATVYIPLVDFKFINDTPYWLLMETYINQSASRITWKFYSTYDGRTMEWLTTGPTNKIKPEKPLYQLNPDLASGEIKQVDWESEGADVTVSRSVYKDNALLFEDSFFTRYSPWRAVYEYGPGTEGIPKP